MTERDAVPTHPEPPEYVLAHIRQRLALGAAHELGIAVEVTELHVTLSGWVTSETARRQIVEAATELAADREVIDDLEVASAKAEPAGRERDLGSTP